VSIIISKNLENKLSPTLSDYFISFFLMMYGLFFIIWFCQDNVADKYYLTIFNIIIFGIFPLIVALPVLFTKKSYINYEQKYIRIDSRIIPFSDISTFSYKNAFTTLKNPLASIFVLNLVTGEQIKFSCYFKGSNFRVCDMLKKAELIHSNCL